MISRNEQFQTARDQFMSGARSFAAQSMRNSRWITGRKADRAAIKTKIDDLLRFGVEMCKNGRVGFPRDISLKLMDELVELKKHCEPRMKKNAAAKVVRATKMVRYHYHMFLDAIRQMDLSSAESAASGTLRLAESKATDAARMRDDPLALLAWASAAKEAGWYASRLAKKLNREPVEAPNADVHGIVWEKMKTILASATALTHEEVDQLGMHLRTDTHAGQRVPQLVKLHKTALRTLKGKAHWVARAMIEALRDKEFKLVAQDFLNKEWRTAKGEQDAREMAHRKDLEERARREHEAVKQAAKNAARAKAKAKEKRVHKENEGYLPASRFRKGMRSKLWMAAFGKTRKSKQVSTKNIRGVTCYSVADATRWWGNCVE